MAAKVIAFPRVRANDNSTDPTPPPPYAGAQVVDQAVQDFLRIGGRIMLSPTGRYQSNINVTRLTEGDGRNADTARRFITAEARRGAKNHLRALVRKFGDSHSSGWRVLTREVA